MSNPSSEPEEHLSEHGFYHELLNDDQFILAILNDPLSAVTSNKLKWDDRNDERLAIARDRIMAFARTALQEVRVLNFRNCMEA